MQTLSEEYAQIAEEADGLVLYTDGSYRRDLTGWGVHGYAYSEKPLSRGIGTKRLPTDKGYDAGAKYPDTVTPLFYVDAFGTCDNSGNNNSAELEAAIAAMRMAELYGTKKLTVRADSKYVLDGIQKWVPRWKKRDWKNSNGLDISYRPYWETLDQQVASYKKAGGTIEWLWIKGHSGCPGNDIADVNAKNGGALEGDPVHLGSDAQGYHNPKVESNPLIMKSRMVFSMGDTVTDGKDGHFYHFYHLGAMSNFGHKKEDTRLVRHAKTDTLFGRRIADAAFCVLQVDKPDEYLELLKEIHSEAHQRDVVDLAVIRLDHAYKPAVYQRIKRLGKSGLVSVTTNRTVTTVNDELISLTFDPPRLAMEGVEVFQRLQRQLQDHLAGRQGKGVFKVDVTDQFYETTTAGKSKKAQLRLNPEIPAGLNRWVVTFERDGVARSIPALLGIDVPDRNTLNRLVPHDPKVTMFMVASGPEAYQFGFFIDTEVGSIAFQSPYTNFLIPKE